MAVWDLAITILGNKDTAAIFPTRNLPNARRTTAADLLSSGYRMRTVGTKWSDEEVIDFFRACAQYRQAPEIAAKYPTVYEWMAFSALKGGKSRKEVRLFAEQVFSAKKRNRSLSLLSTHKDGGDKKDPDEDEDGYTTDEEMERLVQEGVGMEPQEGIADVVATEPEFF